MSSHFPPIEYDLADDDPEAMGSFAELLKEGGTLGSVEDLLSSGGAHSNSLANDIANGFCYVPAEHARSMYLEDDPTPSAPTSAMASRAPSPPQGYHSAAYHAQLSKPSSGLLLSSHHPSTAAGDNEHTAASSTDTHHAPLPGRDIPLGALGGFDIDRNMDSSARVMGNFFSSNDMAVLNSAHAPPAMAHLAAAATASLGVDLLHEPTPPSGAAYARGLPPKRSKRGTTTAAAGARVTASAASTDASGGGGASSSTGGHGGYRAVEQVPSHLGHGGVHSLPGRRHVCSMWLQSEDEMQCRFAVKNDDKVANQKLGSVQSSGYVEYKARYCKKRGLQTGYGYFHIGFLPFETSIFPLQRLSDEMAQHVATPEEDAVLFKDQIVIDNLERVTITVRLYQSFRGCFPTRHYVFSDDEVYQNLYIKEWQDATLMVRNTIEGTDVETHPDGEYICYTIYGADLLKKLDRGDGLRFPCPIPAHPDRLNDVGMLRMQVTVKFLLRDATPSSDPRFVKQGQEFNTWTRIKVVQQLSGSKRRYANMQRPAQPDWCLPPRPQVRAVDVPGGTLVKHVLGAEGVRGDQSVDFLQQVASYITEQIVATTAIGEDHRKCTNALHAASTRGDMGVILLLLQHRVTLVHTCDEVGRTPLHCAAKNGNMAAIRLLIEAGAQTLVRDDLDRTAAALALTHGHTHVRTFLQTIDEEERLGDCCTLYRAAAIGNARNVVRHLDPTDPNFNGQHDDPNASNLQGHTALFLAIDHNQPMTVYTLLRLGANPKLPNRSGFMAIHQAAYQGDPETLAILLHHDANSITLRARDGSLALHLAAKRGHVLCVQILLSCGAEMTLMDGAGKTPLQLAEDAKMSDVVLLLLTREHNRVVNPNLFGRCRVGGSLHIAAMRGDVALARKLLVDGAMPDAKDEQAHTALHHAARNGRFLVVDELLTMTSQRYASRLQQLVYETLPDGRNALHLACSKDSVSCAIVMLSRKLGDLHHRDHNGDTALHIAARNGQVFVTAFLLLGGVDSTLKNKQNLTPYELACSANNTACSELLRAQTPQLQKLAKLLESPPTFPWESARKLAPETLVDWRDLGAVLSRMWHATHSACQRLRTFRSDSRSK